MVACPLSIATVSCESGTSAKLVDTSVRLVSGELGTSAKLVGTSVRLVGLHFWLKHQHIFCFCFFACLFSVFMADLDVVFFADMGSVLTKHLRA